MNYELPLHQELLLLALGDKDGDFQSGMYLYSVSGAIFTELILSGRIVVSDDKKPLVSVADSAKTGCEILDEVLTSVSESKKERQLQYWISQMAQKKELNHRLAEKLCEQGILKSDEKKVLFFFTKKIYPELDSSIEDRLRARMAGVMFDPKVKPDPRTAIVIAFAKHAGLLRANFAPVELAQHAERIEEIAKGSHMSADATKEAITAIQTAMLVAATLPAFMAVTTTMN